MGGDELVLVQSPDSGIGLLPSIINLRLHCAFITRYLLMKQSRKDLSGRGGYILTDEIENFRREIFIEIRGGDGDDASREPTYEILARL